MGSSAGVKPLRPPTMTGETIASMVAAVHYLAPVLIGRETGDFAGARAAMGARMYANHGAGP